MPEELDIQQLKKEYPEFFENFPRELLEAALSEETLLEISAICLENGIADEEKIENISYIITSVLLGRVPKKILARAIQTSLEIDAETAEKISLATDRQIFAPIKDVLDRVYDEETAAEPKKSSAKDTYRETLG